MSIGLKLEHSNLGFDPDALREKYQQERDKRIRPEGNDQYVAVAGRFAHFVDDPYVEAGITGVRIIEAGGDFGGTWYWNRYPGA